MSRPVSSMRLLACLLALVGAAASAQPYAVSESLGPLQAVVQGQPTGLVPLSAAPDGDGFVVLAMVPERHPVRPLRGHLLALRLDAAGAVTKTRPLSALGAVEIILEPRVAARLHPDGNGFLFGAVFAGVGLRAVRLDADLAPEVIAERQFPSGTNITLRDAVRLTDDIVLFVGSNLRADGYGLRTEPLALMVDGEGGERFVVTVPDWNEAVTDMALLPGAIVLAGWTDEGGGDRAYLVRTFDASAQPTGAQRITVESYPTEARLGGLGDGQALFAAPAADSSGRGRHRMVAAIVGAPGAAVLGSAFVGEPSTDYYVVDEAWGLDALGLALVGSVPAGESGRRLLLARPPEDGVDAWTLSVGSPGTVRPLTMGGDATPTMLSAHAPNATGAERDDHWHLERTTFSAERPSVPWLDAAAAPDAAAFDAYARAALASPEPAARGAALRAYGVALDATAADSVAVSRALQRQADALFDHDFRSGADVLLAAGARVLRRTRPAMTEDRKNCIGGLFLWRMAVERALGSAAAVPVPERPVTICE